MTRAGGALPTMRVACVGKGGSGKSTVAGTIARLLARAGHQVLALDLDTVPGLAYSLGLGRTNDAGIPAELATRKPKRGWVLRRKFKAKTLVDRYAIDAPERIRFLQLGKLPGGVQPGSSAAFRHVVESFREPEWSIVGDLAAGTRQSFFGWAAFASLVAVIVEPTIASVISARRLRGLAGVMTDAHFGLVVNKARADLDRVALSSEVGLPLWAVIPYDEAVVEVDRAGMAPVDAAPESDAVASIRRFVETIGALQKAR